MYKKTKGVSWNHVEDGMIILLDSSGEYLHLDTATCDFVNSLVAGQTLTEYVKNIAETYPEEEIAQIQMDYSMILNTLLEQGILEASK
ncbi:hypothetical protein JTE88_03640 [Arcanobacterium phocisimile]|uniref:PqqD family protein n=1 Tax=Arcanobacterium phocisimile TaxID=1302235 RepID=A0ABX7ILY4_9ACTO|nr:hypothetical protein [Arcanobacterium phocisimile]QRV02828.1 hypothetical protein JTE88_03640 [Arcanobacterium phocisimile]